MTIAAGILLGAAALMVLLRAVPSLQLLHSSTVVVASLAPYAWVLALVVVVLLVLSRPRPVAGIVVAGLVAAAGAWAAWPYLPSGAARADAAGPTVTVMTMNMRCNQPGDEDLTALVRRAGPDVVVINGLSGHSRDGVMDALDDLYPETSYSPMQVWFECGTLVLSKHPMNAWLEGPSQPVARIDVGGERVSLVAVDLPTPTLGVRAWEESFEELSADVAGLAEGPVMVVGDFNAVVEHDPMRRLMADNGLQDAVVGSRLGWRPTFPAGGVVPPLVALDHVLLSRGLVATDAWTEPVKGQEHQALFVTVGPASAPD